MGGVTERKRPQLHVCVCVSLPPHVCSAGKSQHLTKTMLTNGPWWVQVDGVLMPPDGPDCWPPSDNRRQWLVFSGLDGLTLRGAGTIEGNGEDWWNLPCKPHRVRITFTPQVPNSISLWSTRTTREPACVSMIGRVPPLLLAGSERVHAARPVRQPHGMYPVV